ncbi:tRNA (adenosine(37)-N6)-dimethylallyltransferase MiaA [Nocardioides sp. JQ2195]|uniref:tRNA (adenosine(37)-N6)-dimethylallyltransferase MiaA n=1 Tax=Nocardioides sp. JQ2195 TaxID=2592334 RepID=UPI00143E91C9|nr:tRNA (adenosine(37)-N6)-dimethylallyltransferase MiaA [Nocardioides sp. JQ2195]QIX27979.1 tRNA (adenosine(37)-N6)-dimethylallyltransferase MiaA [Nocardioides sp. JQ2195]
MSAAVSPHDEIPVVAVVGATAAGKTGLSLDLAERLGGEIVNTDAMQVYRGMDIGTAKLPPDQRRDTPHHLLDVLDIDEIATVADFQRLARNTIADLRAREVVPVLVGGSALYTRAVLDRFEFPGTDADVRRGLEEALEADGSGAMHARLRELDPQAAQGIHPSNGRRVVRALEVVMITGEPYSASLPRLAYAVENAHQIGVDIDRDTLDVRIGQRVEQMFDDGFVDEVSRLLDHGLADAVTASRAIGYPDVTAYLAGELTLEQAKERTKTATRRFARKQDGWFRKDPRITWLPWDAPDLVDRAVDAIRG